jgi:hypothetical protein
MAQEGEWVKAKLTYLSADLEGWLLRDVTGPEEPTEAWLTAQLEATPPNDVAAREKWAERLAVTAPSEAAYNALAEALRALGRDHEAAVLQEAGVPGLVSAAAPVDRVKLHKNPARQLLALSNAVALLYQAPSPSAVPVPGGADKPLMVGGLPFEVIETISGYDGQPWARVAAGFTGWLPQQELRAAVPFTRVRSWTGPQVISAEVGDWAGTYYIDETGNVYYAGVSSPVPDPLSRLPAQLWRLDARWIIIGSSMDELQVKKSTVCLYGFCSKLLRRSPALQGGKHLAAESDARAIASSLLREVGKGKLEGAGQAMDHTTEPWQPVPGTYVYTLDLPIGSVHVVVHKSGAAAAFLTTAPASE